MKYDLEQLYRSVKARVKRSADDPEKLKFAETAAKFAREFRDSPNIENLNLFKAAEVEWSYYSSTQRLFWMDFEDALNSGDFCVNRSFIKTASSSWNPSSGWIYLAVAKDKPGRIKIGHTTTALHKRFDLYQRRYGYLIEAIYANWIPYPKEIEKLAEEKFKKHRVSSNTIGDSNEWYKLNSSYCKGIITQLIKNRLIN
jgi:T5orf172 domain